MIMMGVNGQHSPQTGGTMEFQAGASIKFRDRFTGRTREGRYVRPLDAVGPDGHPRHVLKVGHDSARGGLWVETSMIVSERLFEEAS
jgi:hypothetical protein